MGASLGTNISSVSNISNVWQPIDHCADLQTRLQQAQAALVLWGGAHCGVCQALKPRLADMAARHFPHLPLLYVDCQATPAACAQYGVFTLPVLRLYVNGHSALDYARAFGVAQVQQEVTALLARLAALDD
ncbi:Uncharacterised protein [uncultured Comamonas sp.]|nr:Uncharacterised protein [uncultured Comamonas sp.]